LYLDLELFQFHFHFSKRSEGIFYLTYCIFIGPNPIIGCLPLSLTKSLNNQCCLYLTDVPLAFEDANIKILDVVSVADIDAEERVEDSLVEILMLKFGRDFEVNL